MADLKAFVANCLMGGDEITRDGTSWTRDLVTFTCAGFQFTFRQAKNVVAGNIEELKGTFAETSEVVVKDVAESQVQKARETLEKICWLLSFAGMCRVICYGYEYPASSGHTHFSSVVGAANYFRPSIDIRNGRTVKEFVEQTYDQYFRLEKSRKLNVVIDYLVQAERPGQPTELKLILAFVALESLKDTYARSISIPYVKHYFRKPTTRISGIGAKFTFEELLEKTLRAVQMRKGLKRVIRLRNEIIHSGLSRKPHARQWAMYEGIHDLMREYVVRLLGYRGYYLTYASASNLAVKI